MKKNLKSVKDKSTYKQNTFVIFLYSIFSSILTFPLILKLKYEIISNGGDIFQSLAEIINNFERLKTLGYFQIIWDTVSNANFDPVTINTYFMFLFGQPAGYNIFWFFSFVASGFGAYLLVKHILLRVKFSGVQIYISAFTAGFIYTFSSAHFAWSGFRGSLHIEWIPFTILYIMKFIKKPSLKYILLSGIFFILLIQGEPHFAAYFFIFLITFLAFYLKANQNILKNSVFRRYTIIGLVLGISLLLWYYIPLINISNSDENYLNPGIEQTIRYSSDALSIITPPVFSTILSGFFEPLREMFTGNPAENSNYLGFTAMALFIFSLIFYKRENIKEILFWSLSAIGFFILSLGPFLHFAGTIEPKIPLPYLLIYKYVPFFENIRSVGRFWVIALLCFSIAIAFGMQYLLSNKIVRKYNLQYILATLIILLLSAEYLAVPIKTSSLEYSPFYDQIKAENGDFGVVDLPGSTNYLADAKTRYYASIYQKERISGLDPARKIDGNWDFQITTPVLSEILYTLPNGKDLPRDIINHDYKKLANSIFTHYNIPYIIIQKEFIGTDQDYINLQSVNKLREFIKNNFTLESENQDEYIYIYKIKQEKLPNVAYLTIGSGWEDLNTKNDNRKLIGEGELKIFNLGEQEENMQIDLDMNSFKDELNQVDFYYDEKLIDSYFIHDESTTAKIRINNVPMGESSLIIKVSSAYNDKTSPSIYVKNINYGFVTDNLTYIPDFSQIEDDDKSILMLRYPYEYLKDNTTSEAKKIGNHPIVSLQDFVIEDGIGNNKLLSTLPLVNEFFHWQNQNSATLDSYRDIQDLAYYQESMINLLLEKNIGYIYIDKNIISTEKEKELYSYLQKTIPSLEKIDGEQFAIYKIDNLEKNGAIPFVISNGWDILENKLGISKRRKINTEANIYLYSSENEQFNMKFNVRTCADTTTSALLKINGVEDEKFVINDDKYQNLTINSEHALMEGINQMSIKLLESKNSRSETVSCPIWLSDMSIYSSEK